MQDRQNYKTICLRRVHYNIQFCCGCKTTTFSLKGPLSLWLQTAVCKNCFQVKNPLTGGFKKQETCSSQLLGQLCLKKKQKKTKRPAQMVLFLFWSVLFLSGFFHFITWWRVRSSLQQTCYVLLTLGGVSRLKRWRQSEGQTVCSRASVVSRSFTAAIMQQVHLGVAIILGKSLATTKYFIFERHPSSIHLYCCLCSILSSRTLELYGLLSMPYRR